MNKIIINIHQRAANEFWVRMRGKHHAFTTADAAISYARELQAKAGGFDHAVIQDETGGASNA